MSELVTKAIYIASFYIQKNMKKKKCVTKIFDKTLQQQTYLKILKTDP